MLLHSFQLEMALIARRTGESIVAIVILSNLKRLEPCARGKVIGRVVVVVVIVVVVAVISTNITISGGLGT